MKHIPFILAVFIFGAVVFFTLKNTIYKDEIIDIKENLKVGQIWEYSTNHDDNPFAKYKRDVIIVRQRIIDIKGDYILYIQNKDTMTCTKDYFFTGNVKLIKE